MAENPMLWVNSFALRLVSTLAFGLVTPSCSESCQGTECIPEGCEFLEAQEEARCEPDARCEQVSEERATRRYWIVLEDSDNDGNDFDREETERRTACLADWLNALGLDAEQSVTGTEATSFQGRVIVESEWPAVAPVVNAEAVDFYEPMCIPKLCTYCNDFDATDCEADAFCRFEMGIPIDVERECALPRTFAYCAAIDTGSCEDPGTLAIDEAGRCWEFWEICQEPRLEYGDDVCGPGITHSMPPCEDEADAGGP